jgi:predicted dehydrogenase
MNTTTSTPRLAVVGAGWWSSEYHLPSLATTDRATLAAVVDRDETRRSAAAARYDVPGYADLAALAQAGVADGVLVTVPHEAHHPVATQALDLGLHVFLEKPMALTADDAWDLTERAAHARRHLMLGYTHQVTRLATRVRNAIADGELGTVVHVASLSATMLEPLLRLGSTEFEGFGQPVVAPSTATYGTPGSGGQAWSQLTHATGFVCYVTGLRPQAVAAVMNPHDLAVDLADAISVRFEGGASATLSSTGTVRPGQPEQQELRFYGTQGYALVDLKAGRLEIRRSDGMVEHLELASEENCPPLEPARRFGDLVAGRADNPAPPEPAAHAVEILQAAHLSDRTGRTVPVSELRSTP